MSNSISLVQSEYLIEDLFYYATSWKDIISLSLVNKQYNKISMQVNIELPFKIRSKNLDSMKTPSQIAQVLHITCTPTAMESFLADVMNVFKNCKIISLDFDKIDDYAKIKKICTTVLKKGLSVDLLSSSRQFEIAKIIEKAEKKYEKKNHKYQEKKNTTISLKRVHSDDEFDLLRVPKNVEAKKRYLLQQLLELPDASSATRQTENPFIKVNHISKYENISLNTSGFFISCVDDNIPLVKRFINGVIKFNEFHLLITSVDVFYHNHAYDDDCAQRMRKIHQTPTAKIMRKTYTGNDFAEASIFIGHYELLIVGGYIETHGCITPFLGSSLAKFDLEEEVSTMIRIPMFVSECTLTKRLLNQYVKRHSHEYWGVRCSISYLKGFYPISPIEFVNHHSQKAKKLTNAHFCSAVLALITSERAIKQKNLEDLWSLTMRTSFYKKVVESAESSPLNFTDLSHIIQQRNDDSLVGSIIRKLGELNENIPCFFLSLNSETSAKDFALNIVKSSLKTEISKQHKEIINKIQQ